jgi:hypothetical protein
VAGPPPVVLAQTVSYRTSSAGVLPAVVAAVEAARAGAPIPSGLTPPIGQLRNIPQAYAAPAPCIAHDSSSQVTSKVCRLGDRASRNLIVLMGDSHAEMWLPAVLELARHDHWAVVPLLRLGCTPGKWIAGAGSSRCRDWYHWALGEVARLHPRVTLLGGSIGERPSAATSAATSGVIETAQALEAHGPVVVIGDPEGLSGDPVDCLLASGASMARCTTTWPQSSLAAYDRVQSASTQLGFGFVPTRGFFCYERECPAVIGHTIVWWDNSHITWAYSVEVWNAFRSAFLQALPRAR